MKLIESDFDKIYEELSKLYEDDQLVEKGELKKAAVTAGLFAAGLGAIGAGAGISNAVNKQQTQETPISAPADVNLDDDDYLSWADEHKTVGELHAEAIENLNKTKTVICKFSHREPRQGSETALSNVTMHMTKNKFTLSNCNFKEAEANYNKADAFHRTVSYNPNSWRGIEFLSVSLGYCKAENNCYMKQVDDTTVEIINPTQEMLECALGEMQGYTG